MTSVYNTKKIIRYLKCYLPCASGDNCETFDACLLFELNSGSKKATGKQEANELKQSPSNGR
jgi:hypothetical protein